MEIVALRSSPDIIAALAQLLVDTVASGASVSFMHPLAPHDQGARVILGALEDDQLIGTVTLLLDLPPNQPHRTEIAKMMTRPTHRGRGIGRALMREAERIARQRGRTLLTLDTADEDGAAPFYEKLGFIRAGLIPGYALKPYGGLCGTIIYWKRLDAPAA